MTVGPPNGVRALTARIKNAAGGRPEMRVRTAVATTVLAQMLPTGVVKGGRAMKLRFGQDHTRYTRDLDIARREDLAGFIAQLNEALRATWHGFGGRVVKKGSPSPAGVPANYVMQPYEVKLTYKNGSWCSVPLEIGHDEIGDTLQTEMRIADELCDLFRQLGLPDPAPVPVLAVHHQVAQKLHACTAPGSERAHDLVDLQILDQIEAIDLAGTRDVANRLFRFRNNHNWPPKVVAGPEWDTLYEDAAEGMNVSATVTEAIDWTNELINRIDTSV